MSESERDPFTAGEQGLGYMYQPRLALLKLLQLPEGTGLLMEKDDDLDFVSESGVRSLASLKHKAEGGRVTDLSTDFWKSVRIWLARYNRDDRINSNLRFFLFTTEAVSPSSFLRFFTADAPLLDDGNSKAQLAMSGIAASQSAILLPIAAALNALGEVERDDFFSRVVILDGAPRIEDVATRIKEDHMRSVRREVRAPVLERLIGWWDGVVVGLLSGSRTEPVFGYEVSDRLSTIAEEYQADNLPITLRGREPHEGVDVDGDPRLFVAQLRAIGIASGRIRNAILDYYRAFEQRSAWARESLLVAGEIEDYEDRLVDEWGRYKDVVFEQLDDTAAEEVLVEAGRELYRWADLETGGMENLRIRKQVTEPYVLRGGFHILANSRPLPRVYWHPKFLSRLQAVLGATA